MRHSLDAIMRGRKPTAVRWYDYYRDYSDVVYEQFDAPDLELKDISIATGFPYSCTCSETNGKPHGEGVPRIRQGRNGIGQYRKRVLKEDTAIPAPRLRAKEFTETNVHYILEQQQLQKEFEAEANAELCEKQAAYPLIRILERGIT